MNESSMPSDALDSISETMWRLFAGDGYCVLWIPQQPIRHDPGNAFTLSLGASGLYELSREGDPVICLKPDFTSLQAETLAKAFGEKTSVVALQECEDPSEAGDPNHGRFTELIVDGVQIAA